MTIKVELTNQEAELLRDIIEWWAEGYIDSEEITIESADSIDEMLDLTSAYNEQLAMCKSILSKVPRRTNDSARPPEAGR